MEHINGLGVMVRLIGIFKTEGDASESIHTRKTVYYL